MLLAGVLLRYILQASSLAKHVADLTDASCDGVRLHLHLRLAKVQGQVGKLTGAGEYMRGQCLVTTAAMIGDDGILETSLAKTKN